MREYFIGSISEMKKLLSETQDNDSIKINLKKGIYEVGETIEIKRNNVHINGNGSHFYGSKKIKTNGNGKINEIDLKQYGIDEIPPFSGGPYSDFWDMDIPKPYMTDFSSGIQLYYNENTMTLSRYPKSGFIKTDKALGTTAAKDHMGENIGFYEGIVKISDEEFKKIDDFSNVLLVGYWMFDWAVQRHKIKSFDHRNGIAEFEKPYHKFGYREENSEFYVLNVKNMLSENGEWAVDFKNLKLYFIPYDNQDYINIALTKDVFYADGKGGITIENLKISECTGTGIKIENCKNVSVLDCKIKNVGAWAVILDNCCDSSAKNISVKYTGGGGIAVSGGDRNSLIPSNNIISDCDLTEVAVWHRTYLPALQVCGCGGTISRNKVYNVPHFAIVFHGNNHVIEKNEISNACYESNDAGAVYSGRDWTCRGNILRYNYLHDLSGRNNKGCNGFYFDDALSSADVYGNIFANCYLAVIIGGGRDFKIHNNVFFNCKKDVQIDNRLNEWGKHFIVNLKKRLSEVDYRNDVWKKAYPELYTIFAQKYWLAENNSVNDNLII